jgi:chaperone required for assembly of F1-ATPase
MQLPEHIDTTDIRGADGLYTLLVNDEPLRTPKGHPVQVPSWDLANAMADELMAEGRLDLQHLTLYTLYATQRDFVEDRTDATIAAVLQHLPNDFALHPDPDPALAAKQLAAWTPLLAFMRAIGPEVPMAKPLQDIQLPWELTEGLRTPLTAMSPAQLTVVLHAVTNFGSVVLGILLAQQGLTVDQAVSALTVTARHMAEHAREELESSESFAAEMRQLVLRLRQYVRLSAEQ